MVCIRIFSKTYLILTLFGFDLGKKPSSKEAWLKSTTAITLIFTLE